jgi:hypothetical protein
VDETVTITTIRAAWRTLRKPISAMQNLLFRFQEEAQCNRYAQAPDPPAMMGHQDGSAVTVRLPETKEMEAIYGLALMSASILLLAVAAKYRNGPNALEWMKSGVVLQSVLFTTVAGFIFAISMLIQFVFNIKSESFGTTEAALLGLIVVVTWICWRAIKKMPAPIAVTGTADNLPPPANTDGPTLGVARKGARKAA